MAVHVKSLTSLADVHISSPTEGEVLRYESGQWVNGEDSHGAHNHDDRYYTEGETDALLAAKADNPHVHSGADITTGTVAAARLGASPTASKALFGNNTWIEAYTGNQIDILLSPGGHVHGTSDIIGLDATLLLLRPLAPRVTSVAYAASLTPNANTTDIYQVAALTGNVTINNPSGTPVNGQNLTIRLLQNGAGGHTLTLGSAFIDTEFLSADEMFSDDPDTHTWMLFTYTTQGSINKWVLQAANRF